MTALAFAVTVSVGVAALVVWARHRLAVARRQRVELEAFRAALGIPPGRFRIVDVSLGESVRRALRPRSRLPRFDDVHQVRFATDAEARGYADQVRGETR